MKTQAFALKTGFQCPLSQPSFDRCARCRVSARGRHPFAKATAEKTKKTKKAKKAKKAKPEQGALPLP